MLIWSGLVGFRAWTELETSPTVHGLHRNYLPPYEHRLGWVIDPRKNALIEEVVRRYAPEKASALLKMGSGGYDESLQSIGLPYETTSSALNAQSDPHLRLAQAPGRDHLFIGQFGIQFVLFYSELGVVLTDEMPPATEQVRLIGAREAPW